MVAPVLEAHSGPTFEPETPDNILTLTTPTGTVDGDLLIALFAFDGDSVNETAPAGWVQIATIANGTIRSSAYRYEVAGTPAASYDFDKNDSSGSVMGGGLFRISGHDSADPIDVFAADVGATATPTCPTVTTTVDDTLILRLHGGDDDDYANTNAGYPAGHTGLFADDTTQGSDMSVAVAYTTQASAGATGTGVFITNDSADQWACITIAIKPAAGGGSVSLTPNDVSQSHALDITALTQAHNITANEINHGQALDTGTLSQGYNLSIDDIDQAQSLDLSSLVQQHTVIAADLLQGVTLDASSITQQSSLIVNAIDQAVTLDGSVLTQAHNLAPAEIDQGNTLDVSALVTAGTLSGDAISQAQTVDAGALTQHHQIAVNDLLQSVDLAAGVMTQHHVINAADIDQAHTLAVTTISSFSGVSPQDIAQGQPVDVAIITQHHAINPDEINQAQTLATAAIDNGLTPDVVQIVAAEITIVRGLSGNQSINRVITQQAKLS